MTHGAEWHWPRFGPTLCSQMTDRERLGLPDFYVAGRFDASLPNAYARLRAFSVAQLLATIGTATTTLAERIAAGNLLALLGDARIRVDQPDMVDVSGGDAEIGLPFGEVTAVLEQFAGLGLERTWIEKESPAHRVILAPFRIGRFPVTNFEYRAFLLDTAHPELPSSWQFRRFPQERANHPVYSISPIAAEAYAQWLARRTGRGFRLPTEAEWEWSAAGPERRQFPWGARYDADLANTAETGLFTSSPVGAFVGGESHFGAADMAGNVEEYVADVYAPYPGGALVVDHLSQTQGTYRVARGGSFARFRDLARTRRRHGNNPQSETYAMGFRLAESI